MAVTPTDLADFAFTSWRAVGSLVVNPGAAGSFNTSAVPIDTQQLMVNILPVNGLGGFKVTGGTTGVVYCGPSTTSFFFGAANGGSIIVPVNGAADSTYKVEWTAVVNAAAFTVFAYSSSLPPGFASVGPQPQALSIPVTLPPDQAIGKAGQQIPNLSVPVTLPVFRQSGVSAPAIGTQAVVSFGASPTAQWRIFTIDASLTQNSGGATTVDVQLLDGASALYQHGLAVSATVGDHDHLFLTGLGYIGTVNTGLTFDFSLGIAGTVQRVNIGVGLQ